MEIWYPIVPKLEDSLEGLRPFGKRPKRRIMVQMANLMKVRSLDIYNALDDEHIAPIFSTDEGNPEEESDSAVITDVKVKRPKLYAVILHNDDYTTMEFVIEVLIRFFSQDEASAMGIMLKIHTDGYGICGTFTREIAETKMVKVNEYSRDNGHPLKCTMEPE